MIIAGVLTLSFPRRPIGGDAVGTAEASMPVNMVVLVISPKKHETQNVSLEIKIYLLC